MKSQLRTKTSRVVLELPSGRAGEIPLGVNTLKTRLSLAVLKKQVYVLAENNMDQSMKVLKDWLQDE